MTRALLLAALVVFVVAAVLVVIGGESKLVEVLTLAGLGCLAAGHAA